MNPLAAHPRSARRVRLARAAAFAASLAAPLPLLADTWRGTAPFCEGRCLAGEEQAGSSDYGDGGYCVTGKKVLCRNRNAQCKATLSRASCYGVVMVCENGYKESLNGVWHTCTTYGCGLCAFSGRDESQLRPQSIGRSAQPATARQAGGTCRQGYVWREAIANDRVCVPPPTRSAAAADNRSAAGRVQPGATPRDACRSGFVWREVVPNDHVCVTPRMRAEVARDNSLAATRVLP